MRRSFLIPFVFIAFIVVGIIAFCISPWVVLYPMAHVIKFFTPTPPEPINTYGEFPFRLVYEVDGEQFTVEDVLVCEFDGRGENGKSIIWKGRMLSNDKPASYYGRWLLSGEGEYQSPLGFAFVLLEADKSISDSQNIYYDLGNCEYYLGYQAPDGYSPGLSFRYFDSNEFKEFNESRKTSKVNGFVIEEDVLWEQYKIRIIEVNFAEPLKGNGISLK